VIYEPEAEILRGMAGDVAAGKTLYSIAKRLNTAGVPGPTGGEWTLFNVRSLLLRPSGAGKRQFQGTVIRDATWDAILDDELYYSVVKILTDPSRRTSRDSTVKYLLSGIAVCGPCLAEGKERILRAMNVTAARSYTCQWCFRASARVPMFDAAVETTVLEYVSRPEFAASLRSGGAEGVSGAIAEAQVLEGQLEEARRLAATFQGGRFLLSPVSLARMEQELLPRIEATRSRAVEVTVPPVLLRLAGSGAWTVWHEQLDLAQRRTALRALVRPALNRAGRGVHKFVPGRVSWEWLR
jgi:hypothetical protein